MGLFDRLRSTGQAVADSSASKANTSEQDASRLIEQGHVLEAGGRLDEAMQCYLDAIRMAPNPARAHLNRGNILLLKGDLPAALDAFRTAIQYKPDYAGAYYNIGNALLGNKQLDEAVASYRRALQIEPDYAEVHCALGVALKELGQFEAVEPCFRKALEINPDLVEAHLNLGSFLLSQGRYTEAWPEYEVRYDPNYSGRQSIPPNLPFPKWQGQPLDGKSIVVWPEQGFGDVIQFARYIPMLKGRNVSRLTLVCKTPLKALLEKVEGVDNVVLESEAASLPIHDYWTFPLSLPQHFSTTVETIPSHLPYLSASPERLKRWCTRLPTCGLMVGLVWKGNMAPGSFNTGYPVVGSWRNFHQPAERAGRGRSCKSTNRPADTRSWVGHPGLCRYRSNRCTAGPGNLHRYSHRPPGGGIEQALLGTFTCHRS
jgi:Tfp pilus assembly protein PilF